MSKGDVSCNLEEARQLPIDFNCRKKISEILNEKKKMLLNSIFQS